MPKFFVTLADRQTNQAKEAGIMEDISLNDAIRSAQRLVATRGSRLTVSAIPADEETCQKYQQAGLLLGTYYLIADLGDFGVAEASRTLPKPERIIPAEWYKQPATQPQIDAMYRDAEKVMFWQAEQKNPTKEAVERWIRRHFGLLEFPQITKAKASIAIDWFKTRLGTKIGKQDYSVW